MLKTLAKVHFAALLLIAFASASPLKAEEGDAARLFEAMRMADIISVMHQEGLAYGRDLGESWMPGQVGPGWEAEVASIYNEDNMISVMRDVFVDRLEGSDLEDLITFFASPTGETIIGLETSARQAFLDETLEEAAIDRLISREEAGYPRVDQIKAFVDANDYVERNVIGALNANYAFYEGLIQAIGSSADQSPGEVLSNVWSQEEEIRTNTREWLYAYLFMSYNPLEDAQLEAYQALLQTEAGKAATSAMFAGYDMMYVNISRELGFALGQRLQQQDL